MIGLAVLEEIFTEPQEEEEDMKGSHTPVMLKEVMELLNPQPSAVFVDGTLGLAGHAREILKRIGPQGKLIGIDRDRESLKRAEENLKEFPNQYELVQGDFRHVDEILGRLQISKVDGILLDLGISSFQLDCAERGFSLKLQGPLDMRMDQAGRISAYDLVNSLSENELAMILKDFGQERWYKRIARRLIEERSKSPIETTQELTGAVLRARPYRGRRERIHPATRTFQALRIAVNRELESLEMVLDKCVDLLKEEGRIAVISFHSLEDRIVKMRFKTFEQQKKIKILCKKPLRAAQEEMGKNPRCRSARLRAAERI